MDRLRAQTISLVAEAKEKGYLMSDLKVRPPEEKSAERSPAARSPGSSPPLRNGEKQVPHTARKRRERALLRAGKFGMTGGGEEEKNKIRHWLGKTVPRRPEILSRLGRSSAASLRERFAGCGGDYRYAVKAAALRGSG